MAWHIGMLLWKTQNIPMQRMKFIDHPEYRGIVWEFFTGYRTPRFWGTYRLRFDLAGTFYGRHSNHLLPLYPERKLHPKAMEATLARIAEVESTIRASLDYLHRGQTPILPNDVLTGETIVCP